MLIWIETKVMFIKFIKKKFLYNINRDIICIQISNSKSIFKTDFLTETHLKIWPVAKVNIITCIISLLFFQKDHALNNFGRRNKLL